MIHELIDMDTQEPVRYVNELSNPSTVSSSPPYAFPPTPAHSPATALGVEFSNLNLPSNSNSPPLHYATMPQHHQIVYAPSMVSVIAPQQQQHHYGMHPSEVKPHGHIKSEYTATLRILEHPVEKFRFRYKSEMHGTHGSLNGANSKRTPKTFPEVELCNYAGRAVIRCSLFQTNLDSPHSHQLVVRKDEADICDPHDLHVSQERGFVAQFQNMGIIHTAKKFIFDELLKKKRNRMCFEKGLGFDDLTTKQVQELHKETEKETKDMNLNQVRLCFEAFNVDDHHNWMRIASPVYTSAINNRKSAQTGELRIVRLSIATGTVLGGDDLILLVEKVSKKNIKVRFYEVDDDDECIWEAYGKFRESDVHHQYAIVCSTPAYKDKDVDHPVDVNIELVRPSDDERSGPPVTFRYKPRDAIASRKRRRTCSTAATTSGSSSAASSFEVPRTVQEQQQQQLNVGGDILARPFAQAPLPAQLLPAVERISHEYNRDLELGKILNTHQDLLTSNSEDLFKYCPTLSDLDQFTSGMNLTQMDDGRLEHDGTSSVSSPTSTKLMLDRQRHLMRRPNDIKSQPPATSSYLQRIFQIYETARTAKHTSEATRAQAAKQVADIFAEHAERSVNRDTLIHDIIANDQFKWGLRLWQILNFFQLKDLFNRAAINEQAESGLHCACQHDRAHYIRPLLSNGCDQNLQDARGNTALHVAVLEGHHKCVDSLLSNVHDADRQPRLDLTIRNDEGLTALHLAIRMNSNDVAEKLLRFVKNSTAGAEPLTTLLVPNTKDGNTPLHMAVVQQCLQLIKVIMDCPQISAAQILETRNAAGHTAIDLAKHICSKMGREIHAYLTSQRTSDNKAMAINSIEVEGEVTIKEEETSSSNEDDEEENSSSNVTEADDDAAATAGTSNTIEEDSSVTIKEEFPIDEDDHTRNLECILEDDTKFKRLVALLDINEKWKDLAHKSQMQHLICIWNNAGDMLRYVKKKASSIEYRVFAAALAVVDKEALHVLQKAT